MKKNCEGCRAIGIYAKCNLGYKTEKIYFDGIGSPVISIKPLENCPKPKTYKELFEAKTNNLKP